MAHDVVEHLQFRRTRLPVADAALSAFETEAAIRLEVATTPSLGTSLYAVELRVPVLGTLPPVLRQAFLVLLVYLARHCPQVRFGELAVVHACVGHHGIGCASRFIDAHVEFAASQSPLNAAEEDGDAVGLHRRMGGDELVLVGLGVEVEQVVLLRIDLAALVELAAVDADIVVLGSHRDEDEFQRLGLYVVDLAKRLEENQGDGCRRREASDGERAFDDTTQAARQGVTLAEFQGRSAQVVGPVTLLVSRHIADMELGPLVELEGTEFHHAVVLGAVGKVDAFVDGQARNLAQVRVAVCTDGADTIGAESHSLRLTLVNLLESFLAFHRLRISQCLEVCL